MKHLIKTLFFGYLPLGWKRLFRAIMFFWVFYWVVLLFIDGWVSTDLFISSSVFILLITLSYVISGFIKQKKV